MPVNWKELVILYCDVFSMLSQGLTGQDCLMCLVICIQNSECHRQNENCRIIWIHPIMTITCNTAAILDEIPAMICKGLQPQNHRKMAHFIASCGRALRIDTGDGA